MDRRKDKTDIMTINEKLDKIKHIVTASSFLENKGLGNEIPFYIFDYEPQYEIVVRNYISRLLKDLNSHSQHKVVLEVDLYDLMLELLHRNGLFDKVVQLEKKQGSEKLLKSLKPILKEQNFITLFREKITNETKMIFITGVGKVYPYLRSHTVLNNLHDVISDIPVVTFFPGTYDQVELRLFSKLKDDNYYRAFILIG